MRKLVPIIVLLGVSGVFAFAQPTWYTSADLSLPVELWSGGESTAVNYSDVALAGGANVRAFYPNGFGFFLDFGLGPLLSRTANGRKVTFPVSTPSNLFVAAGGAYRIPLNATPMSLSIAVGPRYSLLSYTTKEIPKKVTRTREGIFIVTRTLPAGRETTTYQTFGVIVEPAIIIAFGPSFFLEAGVNIGVNFWKEITYRGGRGSNANSIINSQTVENYFGFGITPHIGIGFLL